MKQRFLKLALFSYIWKHNLRNLMIGRISPERFIYLFKKQTAVVAVFRHAKYSRVGKNIFIDPFAPFFPSPYFLKAMDNNAVDTYPLKPNYAQISITNTCPCRCFHCHVKNTEEADLPRETILNLIREIARNDFPLLFFVGGEPFSRFDDLVDFVREANASMDTRIFTSGIGATRARLQRLKEAGLKGILVSLDGHEAAIHNAKRANPQAFQAACDAIRDARSLGIFVSAVCCTTGKMARSGEFAKVVSLAESLGAHSIQLNEIRPVGAALDAKDQEMFLSDGDKKTLIDFYQRENAGSRPISITLPWYLEEPYHLGCTATSGQKVYIDARGNVQPCELLKIGLGNITREPFSDIWQGFRETCRYPVRECIVWRYNALIEQAPSLPLEPALTRRTWPSVFEIEQADVFKRIPVKEPISSLAYFQKKYNLGLQPHRDFTVRSRHWLPRKLGVEYVALSDTLFCRDAFSGTPLHEYLHLAQCRRWGLPLFIAHYLVHLLLNLIRTRNFGQAFREIPFEVEARAYEACIQGSRPSPAEGGS